MRIKIIYLLLMGAIWPSGSALAKEDCQTATTSADVMRCVNQNHEDAQAKLNDVYKTLSLRESGKTLDGLEALQTLWIEYRDRECEAETEAIKSQALKRLEGIKCNTRLIHERIDALQRILDAETGSAVLGEPPSTQQPRWVNALSQRYQDIYWHYGGFSKGDLDCDDDAEFVIAGLTFDEKESVYKTVIAVSENPVTGKPRSNLIVMPGISFVAGPDGKEIESAKRCSGIMSFVFDMPPKLPIGDQDETAVPADAEGDIVVVPEQVETCNRRLIITRKTSDQSALCAPVTVFWDGQNYVIED